MKVYFFKLPFVVLICIMSYSVLLAQEETPLEEEMTTEETEPLNLTVQTLLTDFKNEAISLGIDYARSLDKMFQEKDIFVAQKNSLFQLTPGISIQSGTEEAFSSIQLKLSGIFMTFRTTWVDNVPTPDLTKGFQTFPISLGVETTNRFNTINGIAEVGWVPWYKKKLEAKVSNPFRTLKFGVFIQTGYKFNLIEDSLQMVICEMDSTLNTCDHSKEDSLLLRTKASLKINTNNLVDFGNGGLGLSGLANGWYDIKNKVLYYRVQASLRFYFNRKNDKYFDISYEKGSGAPNFNTGSQFGMGLTVAF